MPYALEVEEFLDEDDGATKYRALVWKTVPGTTLREGDRWGIVTVVEADDAASAVYTAIDSNRNVLITHAKHKGTVVEPDHITVGECARAMAGVW